MYSIAPFCPHYALLKIYFLFFYYYLHFPLFFLFTRQRKLFRTDRFPVRTQVHLCRRRRRPGRGECCQTGELYLPFIGISLSLRVPLSLSLVYSFVFVAFEERFFVPFYDNDIPSVQFSASVSQTDREIVVKLVVTRRSLTRNRQTEKKKKS